MKDERGLYYLPSMQERSTRMYVREQDGEVEFRLYSTENPQIWEGHGWLTYDQVRQAAEVYRQERNRDRNPLALYDLEVAKRLIRDGS